MKKGLLVVLSGPSGTGKGTVCKLLKEHLPLLHICVSMTTRLPRPGEINGVDYYFVSREHFEKMIDKKQLLEWARVYDHLYGTPLEKVQQKIDAGIDVVLEIDTQGGLQVQSFFSEAVLIFLLPPSLKELEDRIINRGTEKGFVLQKRLKAACSEIEQARKYDYLVINDQLEEAVETIKAIISSENCRSLRLKHLLTQFFSQEEIT